MKHTAATLTKKPEKPDEVALAKLDSGVQVWNQWRKDRRMVGDGKNNKQLTISLCYARLAGKKLEHIDFEDVDLTGADLTKADLSNAALCRATLSGAILHGTCLSHADLRGAIGVRLDSTVIIGTRFSLRAHDPWSILRRSYSGPRMLFNLILLVVFFTPYCLKASGWAAVNHVQKDLEIWLAKAEATAKDLTSETSILEKPVGIVLKGFSEILPTQYKKGWDDTSLGLLLLGWHDGLLYFVAGAAMLLYNCLRGGLTYIIAPMRDEEDRCGVTPSYRRAGNDDGCNTSSTKCISHINSLAQCYGWLTWPDRAVRCFGVVAATMFVINAIHWLRMSVAVPVTG